MISDIRQEFVGQETRPSHEEISKTGKVYAKFIGNCVVIGELHVYECDISQNQNWERIGKLAASVGKVILEMDEGEKGVMYKRSNGVRYMIHAAENSKNTEYLESVADQEPAEIRRHLDDAGIKLSAHQVFALDLAYHFVTFASAPNSTLKVPQMINEFIAAQRKRGIVPEIEITKIETTLRLLTSNTSRMKSSIAILGEARERGMQEKLAYMKIDVEKEEVMLLVGINHVDGLVKTLQDPTYRSPILSYTDEIANIFKDVNELEQEEAIKKYNQGSLIFSDPYSM